MQFRLALVAAVGLLMAADGPKDDVGKKDMETMQGAWSVAIHEANGEKTTDEQNKQADSKLIVKGDKYTVFFGSQQIAQGTLKLDGTKKPKAIEAIAEDGPTKGQSMLGIYEIKGDEMNVCFGQPGGERPSEFKTKAGTNQILLGYKRIKP